MAAGVAITRMDLDAAGLRRAAAQSRDVDAARRMLALALVLDGVSRTEAAELCGMDRQTLRDWVHRYNDLGVPGLCDRVPPGAKPRFSPEQKAELAELVREGPQIDKHGVVRWRRTDLLQVIEARFGVRLAERSVGAVLRRLGFADCLRDRGIPGTTLPLSRRIKKLCRIGRRSQSQARAWQANRTVVAR